MSEITSTGFTRSSSIIGAAWLVLAGSAFAFANVAMQWSTMVLGMGSASATFWQYFIGFLIMLPMVWRLGFSALKTKRPVLHLVRVVLAALGVQAWVAGLSSGVPIWQSIALVMTSPFFVTIGASLFLGESAGLKRWVATATGFAGGMIILAPWSDAFTYNAVWPIVAAFLWGSSVLCMKALEQDESPQSVTLYLLLFMVPINLALAAGTGFEMPETSTLWMLLIAAGILGAIANGALALAYSKAEAAFLQPFDHIKLLLNVACGFVFFGWVPPGNLWIGAFLIIAASLYLVRSDDART
ncbi:DMT family transporter [Rhodobacteraceae bacterium RKSG542]|uniref:DMT family transporter n=1 Tax=Pseudovibrio flavus TaxID=2529854 RepID=UPI0012BBECE1|nr:DMT family transporter [Pseudovibrio flavus]MTI16412.1 DMT family transporter [Pseudovibrio flavus]